MHEPAAKQDLLLVERFLRDRDEASFRQLYRRHTPVLYLLALRLVGGRVADAEDAVQEAWIRAAEGLARFHGLSSLRTWLCGIVVNRCREAARAAARHGHTALAWDASTTHTAGGASAAAVDVERALAALPDGCREVLVLHDLYGYTHEEVGAMLGIEPGTSKSQLHHARRRLKDALGSAVRA